MDDFNTQLITFHNNDFSLELLDNLSQYLLFFNNNNTVYKATIHIINNNYIEFLTSHKAIIPIDYDFIDTITWHPHNMYYNINLSQFINDNVKLYKIIQNDINFFPISPVNIGPISRRTPSPASIISPIKHKRTDGGNKKYKKYKKYKNTIKKYKRNKRNKRKSLKILK
jgi:hypothetical protein